MAHPHPAICEALQSCSVRLSASSAKRSSKHPPSTSGSQSAACGKFRMEAEGLVQWTVFVTIYLRGFGIHSRYQGCNGYDSCLSRGHSKMVVFISAYRQNKTHLPPFSAPPPLPHNLHRLNCFQSALWKLRIRMEEQKHRRLDHRITIFEPSVGTMTHHAGTRVQRSLWTSSRGLMANHLTRPFPIECIDASETQTAVANYRNVRSNKHDWV